MGKRKGLQFYALSISLGSVLAFVISIPENKEVSVAGFNLGTAYIPLFLFVGFLLLLLLARLIWKEIDIPSSITKVLDNAKISSLLLIFFLIIFLECLQDLIFVRSFEKPPHYQAYLALLEIIYPVLVFGLIFSLISIVYLVLKSEIKSILNRKKVNNQKGWLYTFLGLLIVYTAFYFSGYGFIPYTSREDLFFIYGDLVPTSAPIIGTQVIIIALLVFAAKILIEYLLEKGFIARLSKYTNLLIPILLYGLALILWLRVPLESNSFIDINTQAGGSIYPISDAFYFDKEALRFLNLGSFSDTTTHVFYSFFLAILHCIKGPDYLDIYRIQVAVLALIPVFAYLIANIYHTRLSGIIVGLLFIYRERNGLLLSDDLSGTLVNQFMTESFALLLLLAFLFIFLLWLRDPDHYRLYPLIAGGLIGIVLLVRAELLAVLFAVCLGAFIHLWKKRSQFWQGILQILLIASIIAVPWMSRNYARRGVFSLDKGNYIQKRISQYLSNIQDSVSGENSGNPDYAESTETVVPRLRYMPNQIVSSLWQSILILPSNHQPLLTAASIFPDNVDDQLEFQGFFSERYGERYVKSSPYFWYSWDGKLDPRSVIPVVLSFMVIAIGAWRIWKKENTLVMILPLVLLSHVLIWAFARYSGGRFIKPSDWIPMFFYGVGISVLMQFLISVLIDRSLEKKEIDAVTFDHQGVHRSENKDLNPILIAICLMLIGLSPVAAELIYPGSMPHIADKTQLISVLDDRRDSISDVYIDIENDISNPEYQIYFGKALYPRYFNQGEQYEDDRGGKMPDGVQSRLDFYLITEDDRWISLPLNSPEGVIKHYDDVLVVVNMANIKSSPHEASYLLAEKVFSITADRLILSATID